METGVTGKGEGVLRSELIEVEDGKTYLMSVKVKTENSKGTHFHIYTYEDGDIGLTIGYTPMPEGTQDWKVYSQHIEIPKGVTVIRIFLRAGWVQDEAKGQAITWWDDIELVGPVELPD